MKIKLTNFKITTNILTLSSEVKDRIIDQFLDSREFKRLYDVDRVITQFFFRKLMESDTVISLINGSLGAELGLSKNYIDTYLDSDIFSIVETYLELDYSKNKTKFVKIHIKTTYEENLDLQTVGTYQTDKGATIYWLLWLLYMGTQPVVEEHIFYEKNGYGRSGGGIMIEIKGGNYSIDERFAGTENDNFFTRTIMAHKDEFLEIIKRCFDGT